MTRISPRDMNTNDLAFYERGMREGWKQAKEAAEGIAQKHLGYVKPHNPDDPGPDDVAQGYGNAALNIRNAIRAMPYPGDSQ